MKRSRTGMLLIGLTALALSAGVVAGMLAARLPAAGSSDLPNLPPPASYDRTLADELGLSDDQRQQMRQTWEGVRGSVHRTFNDAQRLQNQRDDEIVALLSEQQKPEASKIFRKYADRYADLTKERDKLFDKGVADTNKFLTPEQQKKYAEILRNHQRPSTEPASADTTQAIK